MPVIAAAPAVGSWLSTLFVGGVGFAAGSLTSGLIDKLFKLGVLAAGAYLVYLFGVK